MKLRLKSHAGVKSLKRVAARTTSVAEIYTKDLLRVKSTTPSLPEQKKIAAFLGVVDEKLAALRARRAGLETYKRGLMQKLFSRTLRFTKPDGTAFPDWEEKRLEEVGERCKAKNSNLDYMRVLTNSAVRGVIDQGDYFDKDIANAENLGGYYIVKEGDFVYNPRISVSAPVGPIKRNDLGDGVMSPLYTVFRFGSKDTTFFNKYFQTSHWHKYMKAVANYGARHDRMAITTSDFMALPLPIPHPDEHRLIADALQAMDAKIQTVADQITRMETFKKGLLQQMFV
jgi:type I restriction enzyme S subunit